MMTSSAGVRPGFLQAMISPSSAYTSALVTGPRFERVVEVADGRALPQNGDDHTCIGGISRNAGLILRIRELSLSPAPGWHEHKFRTSLANPGNRISPAPFDESLLRTASTRTRRGLFFVTAGFKCVVEHRRSKCAGAQFTAPVLQDSSLDIRDPASEHFRTTTVPLARRR